MPNPSHAHLPTQYQSFIHLSRYARWLEDEQRRETWPETVDRYINFMCDEQCSGLIDSETRKELRQAILNLEVMPSMRALMTAGPALARDNVAGFNCSYVAIDHPHAFDEILYILMCGTGVGFSVERQYINKLPQVAERFRLSNSVIRVEDSKVGWADAFRELISFLYSGSIPRWDLTHIRKAGERLKTFGGRASGPEPLDDLFKFTCNIFKQAAGRKLTSLECHDICCKIGEVVVVGGVRRSALISLSNPSDDRMRHAKSGEWWKTDPQRALANNSACYTEKPGMDTFMREWLALYSSKSGERGIFNREAARYQAKRYDRRDPDHDFGTNPCSEIILRSCQFCNLSEVVVRSDDTLESLMRKVRLATILGTMQATLTNFRYLRDIWRQNTQEEALLGVSLTGIMDNALMAGRKGEETLREHLRLLRQEAVETNKEWASRLGINPSAAITCVKPSGTVSQLVDCASGIHPRYSRYYYRRVRADRKDPLAQLMIASNFPYEEDLMKPEHNVIFTFPVKAPENAILRDEISALDQLRLWKIYQDEWCEHKPSITVYVREHEWMEVGAWVYQNFDQISGIAFLPYSDHAYRQAPYEECREEDYMALLEKMPKDMDWMRLREFELEDNTTGTQELACVAGACELVDITSSPTS
ncbi:MAG: ribonucleoside-triphosphate reductase [Lentisphaerae bacterium]|nr:MAG: ribonucleoside-triphosphate reductase [Lentisphaerota bacterium]